MKRSNTANPWTPDGFETFVAHYPSTDWPPVPPDCDRTSEFIARWQSNEPFRPGAVGTVVFTPGLFAEFLPRCFASAVKVLGAAGWHVLRTRASSARGVRAQAASIAASLAQRLGPGERFVWCGHSKGSLDLLYALASNESLRARCAAAIVVQPAVGLSPVVERWQKTPRSIGERLGRKLLATPPFRNGVREISSERDPVVADWLSAFTPVVPTLCAVSWSIRPTSWIDSYHRTLNEIAPGHAHDGQFLLVDQRLRAADFVCLPALDHAQPVMGGFGFDAGRFWRTLVEVALSANRAARSTTA